MKRLLVSTALEASWVDTEPMLFLGEWCRLYSRHNQWSNLDVVVLPYHWDDSEKRKKDNRFLLSLHEELLPELSDQLNEHHGVDHSVRYWRILLGPWLGCFTQLLFDRWSSVVQGTNHHELSGTVVLTGLEDARVPNDRDDFFQLAGGQGWNHHIYGRILPDFSDLPCVRRLAVGIEHGIHCGLSTEVTSSHRALNSKASLVAGYSRLSGRLTRPTDYFIVNTCLRSKRDELNLQLRLGQVPRLIPVEPPGHVPVDELCRRWELGGAEGASFEACLRSLIPEQMPTAYLEGYRALCDESDRRRWPGAPRAIFTGGSHYYDDVFKAWCAAKTEEGAPLVIAQHGGHIGTAWSFSHDHQMAIADRFLSWGWSEPDEPKVVPVGMLKAPTLPGGGGAVKNRALLVTGNLDAHMQSFSLGSHAVASQFLGYLEDQFTFVEALSPPVRDSLTVRVSCHDLDWGQQRRWRDRLPEVSLDSGQRPIMELLAGTKLCIATNNGTTFLESFFLGLPTVIFWDTDVWEIVDSAVPFFEGLAGVGVFHSSPESAARHVSSVWSEVETWWSSPPVVDAVATFKKRYCDDPGNVLDEVCTALGAVAGGVPR